MNKNLQWRLFGVIATIIVSLWLIWPPFTTKDAQGNVIQKGKINLGLDLQGGMHIVLRVDTAKVPMDARKDAIDRAMEIIRNRVDQFGVGEMSIQKQGAETIIVQLPGVTDRERALEIIGRTAHLEFKLVSDKPDDLKKAINKEPVPGFELKYSEGREKGGSEPLLVSTEAALTGDLLVNAKTEFSSESFGEPYVSLTLNPKGAQLFADLTATNVGKRLAIVLDGKVISAPVIREPIPSGQAQISGNFSVDEANDLSVILRAGALPAPVVVEEERTVGPLLGADSIKSGMQATILGGILVVIFMLLYYRLSGVVANIALALNLLLILAGLALFRGTLTLPGIAGLILTIGMAVDANVLIFERMREEMKLGKTLRASINAGYHRALSAIIDSNLTTIIAAMLIFKFGTGPIRGFAVTLTIGLLANLFTAVVVTRLIFDILCDQFNLSKLSFAQLLQKETKIDFIGKRKICYIASLAIILLGVVLFIMRGDKNYGVDFSGGTLQQLMFDKPVDTGKLRDILKDIGVGNAAIQQYGDTKEVIIRTQEDISKKMNAELKSKMSDNPFKLLRLETVGPAVGRNLRQNALLSLGLGLLGIAIYIMFRFDLKYGVAGIIALIHDVLFAVGAMVIAHRQFDLTIVAALLTIAGYSINDTVVIYDRIRENLRLVKKASFAEIVNLSINQMLPRTILTTGVTMLVVIALLSVGGEVINDFSFCIFIGFFVGVYSTIYIASPMVLSWHAQRVEEKKNVPQQGGKNKKK
ncbi:MAG TPA: protein translocase subunit SecD [Candidatus Omnitrophota bacterium]|nr:protein translocase subunit SecD [Candidatus Omnitrophota bacterium]